MQTRFDGISDDKIEHAVALVRPEDRYNDQQSDLLRIAHMAWWMNYMKGWIGWPVTFFEPTGMNYDGHHRVRAVKWLARRRQLQIHIPVRYA